MPLGDACLYAYEPKKKKMHEKKMHEKKKMNAWLYISVHCNRLSEFFKCFIKSFDFQFSNSCVL